MSFYIGIDIGGMSIKAGIVNEEGRILKKSTLKRSLTLKLFVTIKPHMLSTILFHTAISPRGCALAPLQYMKLRTISFCALIIPS